MIYRRKRKYTKRADPGYREACLKARKRDKHQCQMPGCEAKRYIQCHHIRKYSKFPTLRTDPMNLICLCKKHHKMVTGKESNYINMFIQIVHRNDSNTRH